MLQIPDLNSRLLAPRLFRSLTSGGGVDTSGTAGLETHLGEGLFEVRAAGDVWNLDHGAGTETSTQVGWAGKDPTEMVVVHEVVTFLLKDFLDALGGCSEALL